MRCYFVTVHSNCPNILFCRACGKTAEMTPTPGTPRGERNSPPGSPAHRLTLCCRRWRQWLAPHRPLHNLLALFCPLKRHVPSSDLCSVALACFLCVGLYPLGPERLQIWFPGQERGSPSLGLVSAPSSNATSSRKPAMADRRSRSLLYPPAPSTVFPGFVQSDFAIRSPLRGDFPESRATPATLVGPSTRPGIRPARIIR